MFTIGPIHFHYKFLTVTQIFFFFFKEVKIFFCGNQHYVTKCFQLSLITKPRKFLKALNAVGRIIKCNKKPIRKQSNTSQSFRLTHVYVKAEGIHEEQLQQIDGLSEWWRVLRQPAVISLESFSPPDMYLEKKKNVSLRLLSETHIHEVPFSPPPSGHLKNRLSPAADQSVKNSPFSLN